MCFYKRKHGTWQSIRISAHVFLLIWRKVMRGFGFVTALNEMTDWLLRFVGANFLWFLLNLPTIFVLFHLLFLPEFGIFYIIFALVLTGVFLLFPSTAALFALLRDWVIRKEQPSIFKAYFSYFKENYKKGMLAGIVFAILWVIWYVDYYYFTNILENALLSYVFIFFGFFLLAYNLQFFSTLAHFDMKLKEILKTAFIITFGRPLASLLILFVSFAVLYFSLAKVLFLIPFFTGSLVAFFSFLVFFHLAVKGKK